MQAQVAVDRAEQKFAREQRLAEKKVNTIESYQDAEFELRDKKAALDNALLSARATLASAMASRVELDVARQAREDLVVRAPEPTKLPKNMNEPIEFAITKRMRLRRADDPRRRTGRAANYRQAFADVGQRA